MAVMSRAQFNKFLKQGIDSYFGLEYKRHPEEWRKVFETKTTKDGFVEEAMLVPFGAAQQRAEGSAYTTDEGGEAWSAIYNVVEMALGFSITQLAIEDNKYVSLGQRYGRCLAHAMQQAKEIYCAAVLNNAFDAGHPGGDAVSLQNTAHPMANGGTFSNTLATPADISEQAIEDLLIMIRRATDDRGNPVMLRAKQLVIPPELMFEAARLLQSKSRPGTADNDINAIEQMSIFTGDPAVLTRLTDPGSWFIQTDAIDGLKYFQRIPLNQTMRVDFSTDNHDYRARERFGAMYTDPRCTYGSQ